MKPASIETNQRCQPINRAYVLRNEKIRLVILCWSLLAIALASVLFFFTSNVFPLFLTIVLTFLGYKRLDTSLSKSERTKPPEDDDEPLGGIR